MVNNGGLIKLPINSSKIPFFVVSGLVAPYTKPYSNEQFIHHKTFNESNALLAGPAPKR